MEDMDPPMALDWMLEKILEVVEECVPLKGTNTRKNCIPVERRKLWKRHAKLSKQLVVEKNAIKMAKHPVFPRSK